MNFFVMTRMVYTSVVNQKKANINSFCQVCYIMIDFFKLKKQQPNLQFSDSFRVLVTAELLRFKS